MRSTERSGTLLTGNEKAQQDLINMYKHLMETSLGVKKTEPDSSAIHNDRKITLAEIHGILIKHKKKTPHI